MVDAREFLAAARDLARSDQPAYRRTAISRAYYAVYHVAFDLLVTLGFRVGREHRGHETVRAYLAQSRITSVIQTGAQLRDLHNLRVKADYWLRDPHPERGAVVAVWVERAARMIAALDRVAAEPAARARMTAAIQTWQRGAGGRR
jgi:uncharacterized protein (UPF0332 family)